jgi:LAO/AO transport system kinase
VIYPCRRGGIPQFYRGVADDPQRLPEWAPEGAGSEFAGRVLKGVSRRADTAAGAGNARRALTTGEMIRGIQEGNRMVLARAITLVESSKPEHEDRAQQVLAGVLERTGNSIRWGITGVPGVGKSSLIEALGLQLCGAGHKVAVLAVDPSSSVSGGSVLGDKTRMEQLSRHPRAFIRPSPSAGNLGGVARKTRETMLLCEAAGYDRVLVETMGVGQGETEVHSMVDCFLLLLLAGAGDELQGIKKGIVELADVVAVTKADGENLPRARVARSEMERVLQFLSHEAPGWTPPALLVSVKEAGLLEQLRGSVEGFVEAGRAGGYFHARRRRQQLNWVDYLVRVELQTSLERDPWVQAVRGQVEAEILAGKLPHREAVRELLRGFHYPPK